MQAKDISKEQFLAAVRAAKLEHQYASTLNVSQELGAPWKVVRAKTRKLMKQGVIEGCDCGCSSPMFIINSEGLYE